LRETQSIKRVTWRLRETQGVDINETETRGVLREVRQTHTRGVGISVRDTGVDRKTRKVKQSEKRQVTATFRGG
jgi:hypothetical protein